MATLKNAKHEHFAQMVSKGETPPKAYVIAGYSDQGAAQSANRLLKNADVAARVVELQQIIEEPSRERAIEKAALTKAWVLAQLIENVEMAKQAIPVLDRKGVPTGEYEQNLPAANAALKMLGTELGMFIERRETGKPGDFSDLTDDELNQQLTEAERAYAESERAIGHARSQAAKTADPAGN